MYFLFFILRGWRKRSAVRPQTMGSEFPLKKGAKKTYLSHHYRYRYANKKQDKIVRIIGVGTTATVHLTDHRPCRWNKIIFTISENWILSITNRVFYKILPSLTSTGCRISMVEGVTWQS